MLTYTEFERATQGAKSKSVLLGNGFSLACRPEPFRYSTLFAAADFGQRAGVIRQAFEALVTEDFEKVTGRLHAAAELMAIYSDSRRLPQELMRDAASIKDALVSAIASTHPARPGDIGDAEYVCVRRFLAGFDRIYTVNYDLLMYWARNQDELEPKGWSTDDGFREEQRWAGTETDQQIFFLHGGLHLYQHKSGVRKRAFSKDGTPIIDRVRSALKKDIFPLFVSEPTSALKLERITANPYLSYCLRHLSQESGTVLIYGHQLAEVDAHILKALDSSAVTEIFVTVFGDPASDDGRRVHANARAYLERRGRTIEFVDAATVPAWRPIGA
jgi:hypothetical protein